MSFPALVYEGAAKFKSPTTGTAAAGVPVVLTYDFEGVSGASIVVANTGATNAMIVLIEKSPSGTRFRADTATSTAIGTSGSLAALQDALVEYEGLKIDTLRITLTSTSGTTYAIDIKGVR